MSRFGRSVKELFRSAASTNSNSILAMTSVIVEHESLSYRIIGFPCDFIRAMLRRECPSKTSRIFCACIVIDAKPVRQRERKMARTVQSVSSAVNIFYLSFHAYMQF